MNFYLVVILLLIIISMYDILYQKIPNAFTVAIAALSIIYMTVNFGPHGLLISIAGLFLGMALLIIPYAMGGMAAGDVKLMGAVGAVLGPTGIVIAFLYTAFAGGLYAMGLMLAGKAGTFPRRLSEALITFFLTRQIVYQRAVSPEQSGKLCYGVAIAAGSILYIALEISGKGQVVHLWR